MSWQLFFLALSLVTLSSAIPSPLDLNDKQFHFDGYQVLRTFPKTPEQFEAMRAVEEEGLLDFWSDLDPNNFRPTDVMVSLEQREGFLAFLTESGIPHEIWIEDVEKIVAEQRAASAQRVKQRQAQGFQADAWDLEDYHSFEEIQAFIKKLAADFPSIATVQKIGTSYEGRDILLIKISTGSQGPPKADVFIDGGIHAREWISPAVVTYIINELVTNAYQNLDILAAYNFYIVTNVNPDGYDWSQVGYRMWRKTRSHNNSPGGCLGVDGNRNWGYNWGQPGSSPETCSDVYHGPSEFSEPENDAIQKFILSTPVNWKFFLTLHSYGQYVLLPFGDGSRPGDFEKMREVGQVFSDAVNKESFIRYTVGNTRDLLYTTSGTSQDWAKETAGIKYSFTIELRDTGTWGFLLPPTYILGSGRETWIGIKAMLTHTKAENLA